MPCDRNARFAFALEVGESLREFIQPGIETRGEYRNNIDRYSIVDSCIKKTKRKEEIEVEVAREKQISQAWPLPRRTTTAKPPIFPIVVHVRGKAGCRLARLAKSELARERQREGEREREHVELASDNRLN